MRFEMSALGERRFLLSLRAFEHLTTLTRGPEAETSMLDASLFLVRHPIIAKISSGVARRLHNQPAVKLDNA